VGFVLFFTLNGQKTHAKFEGLPWNTVSYVWESVLIAVNLQYCVLRIKGHVLWKDSCVHNIKYGIYFYQFETLKTGTS
jgi:hypothetical protein